MWGMLASLIGGPILNSLVAAYKARLEATNTTDKLAVELAIKDIEAEIARRNAQRDLGIAGMSHPVWWIAWALFVLPVGAYHAAIFMLSIFSIGPDVYAVLKVPAEQEAMGRAVVEYIFLAQGTSGIAGAIISRFKR
jgi:hypothetical protein